MPSKILTQVIHIPPKLKSNENNTSYCPDTKHSWPSPQFHKEKRKKIGKNTNIEIQQNPGLVSFVYKVSLNIKFDGSSWNAKNA